MEIRRTRHLNIEELGQACWRVCRAFARGSADTRYLEACARLLIGTAAAESSLKHRKQIGGGPARGLWQMEPKTAKDIFRRLKGKAESAHDPKRRDRGRLDFAMIIELWLGIGGVPLFLPRMDDLKFNMEHDDLLAATLARVYYQFVPKPIPLSTDGQAAYWKQHYNTPLGAGTVEHYIKQYAACSCEEILRQTRI